jgi:hypothetical protein
MAQVVMIVLDILSHRFPLVVFWPLLPIRGDGSIGARCSPVSAEDPKLMPLHIQVYRQASRNSRWPLTRPGRSLSLQPRFDCRNPFAPSRSDQG